MEEEEKIQERTEEEEDDMQSSNSDEETKHQRYFKTTKGLAAKNRDRVKQAKKRICHVSNCHFGHDISLLQKDGTLSSKRTRGKKGVPKPFVCGGCKCGFHQECLGRNANSKEQYCSSCKELNNNIQKVWNLFLDLY